MRSARSKPQRSRPRAAASAEAAAHRGTARVLRVLEFLAQHSEGFTLSALSRELHVPKSSLLAILRTFADRGYLEQRANGAYALGSKAVELGIRSASSHELPAVAAPALLDLMQKSGETAFLGVLAHDASEIVYIDKVESRQKIRYSASLGERRPLYCTAPGLAVFAFLPEAERERLLASLRLVPLTKRTVTDSNAIRARLDEVRRTGVAVNIDGFIAGASGIAAPIFDRQSRPVATCTVVGPTARIIAQKDRLVAWVKAAGEAVTRSLGGYQPGQGATGGHSAR